MTAPNILTHHKRPVVGVPYSVPTVSWGWMTGWTGVYLDDWPVITPTWHNDFGGVEDWHLDYRFLTPEQEADAVLVEESLAGWWRHWPEYSGPNRWPGSRASRQITLVRTQDGPDWPPVVFRELICRRPTLAPEPLWRPWPELAQKYGEPAEPICTQDGRFLCPHQKMDLTHWPREADGTVICPVHRLRVKVP